jgi:hypothetical protein
MVDALTEAHRVLRANGILADLRPDRDPGGRRVKWLDTYRVRSARWEPAGSLREGAGYYGDYIASDRAVERVIRQQLFTLEHSIGMRLHTYVRDLPTLDRCLAEEWTGITVPASTRERLRALSGRAHEGWLVVADPFRLNILRKR